MPVFRRGRREYCDRRLETADCRLQTANHADKQSIPLDLRPLFNNKGIGTRPGEASFDGSRARRAYPASAFASVAPDGAWTSPLTGVTYALPGYAGPRAADKDNVVCGGQTVSVPGNLTATRPLSLSMLIASDQMQQIVTSSLTLTFRGGSSRSSSSSSGRGRGRDIAVEMRASPAWSFLTLSRGDIVAPYTWTAGGIDGNTSNIFEYTVALPSPGLASVTLPDTRRSDARVHVFAASLWMADGKSVQSGQSGQSGQGNALLQVQHVRPTQKWTDAGHQIVEVTLNNAGSACFASRGADGASIVLEGAPADRVVTVQPGRLKRLCPGDQRRINVGISGGSDDESETARDVNVTVVVRDAVSSSSSPAPSAVLQTSVGPVRLGFLAYDAANAASLERHESPDWFDNAKFGIFVHWGPYAVAGYGGPPDRETYAEWFWWYSTHHADGSDPADTAGYRRRTFGRAWAYDDSLANFSAAAARWQPRAWVDLFADAGATYFVVTAKHHDGFALFDTGATSDRSALHYGPRRDLLGALFDAARQHHPTLKRGTYFSMPEWFNPDFAPYGFGRWPGQLARNPFTGDAEPYTGRTPGAIKDYVRDLQLPQMRTLVDTYGTDILWCDCGPATNATAAFVADWWNRASNSSAQRAARQQPVVNSRCGLPQVADFETPEYATYSSAQRRKWESNRGMDPYSYGFNRATPADAYMDAAAIVYALVDIVAKNGNLLLDIGPRADGSVVDAEAANLRAAGVWIRGHAEALFNTTYWFVQTEWREDGTRKRAGVDVRFTQTDDAFYAIFLKTAPQPSDDDGYVLIDADVPVQRGDVVSLLGVPGAENLAWQRRGSRFAVEVAADVLAKDQYGWVFKIAYGAAGV